MKLIVDIIYSERIGTYFILTKSVKADIGNGTSIYELFTLFEQ